MTDLANFMSGAACFGFCSAGLLFLRFWLRTRDRLFATFSISFFLMAAERIFILQHTIHEEAHARVYILRLIAFVLIIFAVAEKNRVSGAEKSSQIPT